MANVAGSRLFDMKSRFQQRRIVEKEQKLVEKYEANQAKVLERLGTKPTPPGKVRQMFEDRRTKAGIDKSYPLQPLNGAASSRAPPLPRTNGSGNKTIVHNVQQEIKQYSEFNGDVNTFKSQKSIKSVKDINLNEDAVDNVSHSHSLDLDSDVVTNKLPNVGGSFPSQRPMKRETNNNGVTGKPRVLNDQKLNGNNVVKTKKPVQILPKTPPVKVNSTRSLKSSPTVPYPKLSPEHVQNFDVTPPTTPLREKVATTPIIKPKMNNLNNNSTPVKKDKNNNISTSNNVKLANISQSSNETIVIDKSNKITKSDKITQTESNIDLIQKISTSSQTALRMLPVVPVINNKFRSSTTIISNKSMLNEIKPSSKIILRSKTPISKPTPSRPTTMASKKETVSSSNSASGPSCRYCQRNFASDRIGKHEEICSKTLNKKRKQYDALKHRVAGTEVEVYVKKSRKPTQRSQPARVTSPPSNQSNWRKKHEEFINTIRAAKQAQAYVKSGGKLSDLPPPPPSENLDYVSCPHCSRRFNQSAADRHIPKCANYQFNKPKPAAKKR